MNTLKNVLLSMVVLALHVNAGPPKQIGAYVEENKLIKGEVVKLDVPAAFIKFEKILIDAKKKDAKWFAEYIKKNANSSIPPYHEKLGIKKEEYDKYLKLWNQRKYVRVPNGEVQMMLTEGKKGEWVLNVSGKGMALSLLTYIAKDDTFKSPNGVLKRINDIKSPADSIYREWNGHEWRFFKEDSLVLTKENIAIGRSVNKDPNREYGMLIYSLQEVSVKFGTELENKLLIIRFVPKKRKK